ncbi:dynamin family protein, partial [Hydrogenivirga sp. 128-5-R1-1]|uniref:dynamin family protein n=1 Tax=Hydrogenivirga sp. 128-5-R1-1 TaxID=392423 RepID=UPI00015F1795
MQCQSLLNSIVEVSHKYGLDDFYNQVKNLKKDLSISIAFLGEFSSGKSSLINALLGKKILPAMDEPTTAAIVEVQSGKELRAFIELLDSNE